MNLRLGIGLLLGFIISCSGAVDSDVPSPVLQLGEVVIEGELPAAVETTEPTAAPSDSATTEEHFDEADSCGCGRALELPAVEQARAAQAGDVLVWFASQEATLRLDGDSGAIVGSEPGRQVYASGRRWTFETELTQYDRAPCSTDKRYSETSSAWSSILTSDDAQIVMIHANGDVSDPRTGFSRYADLRASIGPYLFLNVGDTQDYCDGTHAMESRIRVFDVERARFVDLATEVGGWSNAISRGRPYGEGAFPSAPDATAIVPLFGDSGLAFARHLTWSNATGNFVKASRPVELDPEPDLLPRSLAPHAQVPAGLAKFRAEHPEYYVGGFSVIAR